MLQSCVIYKLLETKYIIHVGNPPQGSYKIKLNFETGAL